MEFDEQPHITDTTTHHAALVLLGRHTTRRPTMPTTPDEKRRRHIEAVKRCQATTDAIMIRPPLEDGRRIRQYADRNGVSVQALFLAAVADYMNGGKAPEPVKRGPKSSKPSGGDAE